MQQISVIPDTNVFILNLDFVKKLLGTEFPFYLSINVSKAVLEELDKLKMSEHKSISAIDLLNQGIPNIEIEGNKDDRKVEVEAEKQGTVPIQNNDDRILNYAMKLKNPVILTNDKIFAVKCKANNVLAVSVERNDPINALNEILSIIGLEHKEEKHGTAEKLEKLRVKLLPAVAEVLFNELGDNFIILCDKDDIISILQIVIDQFFLFESYIPKKSKRILVNFKKSIKDNDTVQIEKSIPVIYSLFQLKNK